MTPRIPHFHDGHLVGIQLGDDSALLTIEDAEGLRHQLHLSGVATLQMDDFREGNIINDLFVISGVSPDSKVLERLFAGPHPDAAAHYHDKHRAFIENKRAAVANGEASLVVVTPSYGADLVAYCSNIVLQTLPTEET